MRPKPSLSAYLIDVRELAPAWLALYAVTFAIQAVVAPLRAGVAYGLLWLTLTILGQSTAWTHVLAWIAGYGPLILSLARLCFRSAAGCGSSRAADGRRQSASD
jgi:hypothetical protein